MPGERGVRPIYIPELSRELNPLKDLIAFVKICRIIKAEKPDIIHTHTAKAGALGRIAGIYYNCLVRLPACRQGRLRPFGARNDAVKLIHTFHGHVFEGYFNRLFRCIFILIERCLAYFTCRVITVSESVKNELAGLGICQAEKIQVIPLGFELEKFLGVAPRNKEEIVNIGIVGRLAPVKNHRLFLEAAASILKEKPRLKARFKIIGDGQLRSELEEYARELKIAPWVEFTGWQKDLPAVYSDLDVVCLTSLNEGTPVSLIEAMASGKAVVATEVGGVPELLGEVAEERDGFSIRERGISSKPKDTQGFARALTFILANPEARKSLAQAAREYVKTVFSKERLVRDMENLYLEVKNSCG